jgi:DnaK suppressor protein
VLDEKRLQRNKKWLEDERARLQSGLCRVEEVGEQGERPGLGTHMADTATEVFEQAKNLAVCQRLRNTLELINRALEKMDKGGYGLCENCGQLIDPARLKVLPYATLCMSCQAHLEQSSRSR